MCYKKPPEKNKMCMKPSPSPKVSQGSSSETLMTEPRATPLTKTRLKPLPPPGGYSKLSVLRPCQKPSKKAPRASRSLDLLLRRSIKHRQKVAHPVLTLRRRDKRGRFLAARGGGACSASCERGDLRGRRRRGVHCALIESVCAAKMRRCPAVPGIHL